MTGRGRVDRRCAASGKRDLAKKRMMEPSRLSPKGKLDGKPLGVKLYYMFMIMLVHMFLLFNSILVVWC